MAYKQELFLGRGVVYINGVDVGNVSELSLGITTSEQSVNNFRRVNGGKVFSKELIESVEFSANLMDWTRENLALGLRATTYDNASAAFAGVVKVVTAQTVGRLVMLDRSATFTTILKDGEPAVEGTDYELAAAGAGIVPLVAGSFTLSGTYDENVDIEALAANTGTVDIIVALENEYIPGERTIVKLHKVSLSPFASLSVLSEERGDLAMSGQLLADTSKPAGRSQYFTVPKKFGE